MTILAVLFVSLTWSAVLGLILLSARGARGSAESDAAAESARAGRHAVRRASWIALACTAAIGAVTAAFHATGWAQAAETTLRVATFGCFHLVFWVGGRPLHHRLGEVARANLARQSSARRTASLVPRDGEPPVSAAARAVPWGLLGAALLAVAGIALARGGLGTASWTIVAISMAIGATFAATHALWIGAVASTPQTLAGASDPEALDAACGAFRRTLARGVLAMAIATCAVAGGIAVLGAAFDGDAEAQNRIGAWGGGLGGSLIGLSGGVLGAMADRRRRAILDLGGIPPEPGVRRPALRP